jgi:hypothetical protein
VKRREVPEVFVREITLLLEIVPDEPAKNVLESPN